MDKVIVVLGIFAFAKQAPKLIGDVLGLDSGNIKLGIGGKLAANGAFGLAAMLGGGATALTRNVTHGLNNIRDNIYGGYNKFHNTKGQGFGNRAKAFGSAFGSGVVTIGKNFLYTPFTAAGGLISGGIRSGKGGFSAKKFGDVAKAAGEGAANAITARSKREAYRASNKILTPAAHLDDVISGIGKWAGLNASSDALKKTLEVYQQGFDYKKKLEDLALKKSTQAKVYDQQIEALNMAAIKREDYGNDADYSVALKDRADQIDKLKNAKAYEVMKEINEKLGDLSNPRNAEYAELVTSFETFRRQNANLLSGIKDLTNDGWDASWNGQNPMAMTTSALKTLVSDMKKEFRYMENHSEFEKNKNKTAREYAEFIQKEGEKK